MAKGVFTGRRILGENMSDHNGNNLLQESLKETMVNAKVFGGTKSSSQAEENLQKVKAHEGEGFGGNINDILNELASPKVSVAEHVHQG